MCYNSNSKSETSPSPRPSNQTLIFQKLFKAHDHVIDPINEKARAYLEQLSQSFVLLDIVREKKTWVMEKTNEITTSVYDFKNKLETEANQYKVAPEEMLMKHIQSTSEQLATQLKALREKGQIVSRSWNAVRWSAG